MHAHQHARFIADRAFIVFDLRAIRGAYFAKHCPAFRHDFRNAEAVSDFDQLAARDDCLAPFARAARTNRTAAAQLFTTIAASAPVSRCNRCEVCTSRLPRSPASRSYSRFE